jgi:hypothetical protein
LRFFWWGWPCHSCCCHPYLHEFASCRKVAFANGCAASDYFFQHYWIVKSNVFDPTCFYWIEVPWLWSHHNWIYELFSHIIQWWHFIWAFFCSSFIGTLWTIARYG